MCPSVERGNCKCKGPGASLKKSRGAGVLEQDGARGRVVRNEIEVLEWGGDVMQDLDATRVFGWMLILQSHNRPSAYTCFIPGYQVKSTIYVRGMVWM